MAPFIALAWDPSNGQAAETAARLLNQLEPASHTRGQQYLEKGFFLKSLAAGPGMGCILPLSSNAQSFGAVFGILFPRSDTSVRTQAITRLSAGAAMRIAASRGEALNTGYWGSYVAFIRSGSKLFAIADPAASIPCYFAQQDGVALFFSHLERCPFIDRGRLTINTGFISKLLVYDKIQTGETGLNEVKEIGAGERLCLEGNSSYTALIWDPRCTARETCFQSSQEAAHELRATCEHVVHAWASCFHEVEVSLSGGLDSAIVLDCLARAGDGRDVSAFHNLLDSDDSPELGYAEDAVRAAGANLRVIRSPAFTQLPDAGLHPPTVRPLRAFLAPPPEPLSRQGAGPTMSSAVFTGQGGDHVFHARRSPLAFSDYVFHHGLTGKAFAELLNASKLSGISIWKVVHAAMTPHRAFETGGMDAVVRARQARVADLSPGRLRMGRCFPEWAMGGPGLPPLKAIQISSLAHLYQGRRQAGTPFNATVVDPLCSQPLVELCLRLPTYTLCHAGIPRGLARLAFSGRIPSSIRDRTIKGSASGFFAGQAQHNHEQVIGTLKEGELIRHGLLSQADLALLAAPDGPHARALGRTLLTWYGIEAWLRTWSRMRRF